MIPVDFSNINRKCLLTFEVTKWENREINFSNVKVRHLTALSLTTKQEDCFESYRISQYYAVDRED